VNHKKTVKFHDGLLNKLVYGVQPYYLVAL